MTLAFDLLLSTALKLMDEKRGVATGGNNTTLADANMDNAPPDNYYNEGTLFVKTGNNANKALRITNFSQSSGTFTFADAGAACAAGDVYVAFPDKYTLDTLYAAVNEAISELPWTDNKYENDALVTVANQEAYQFPTDGWEILKVEVASSLTSPYSYVPHTLYQIYNDGTNDYILFTGDVPSSAGYRIRLTYKDYPDEVSAVSDEINSRYDVDWVAWKAAARALHWAMKARKGQSRFLAEDHAYAEQRAALLEARYANRVNRTRIVSRGSPWAGVGS